MKKKLHGYRPDFDETATDITLVKDGSGIPFRIAQLAAIEEVRGVLGDIVEGDNSSRLSDNPDMIEDLERRAGELEAMKETDIGGQPLMLDEERTKVLKALELQGEEITFCEIAHDNPHFCEQVQIYLQGGPVDYDRIIELAREEGHDVFLREIGLQPAMTP